ncbi:MAG TPA: sigma 54-interacting transcriptional regulator [Terriglobales bacterium]|jgi:DNA-binding NtrC family response regulator
MAFYFGSTARMKDLERRIGFIIRSGEPVLIEGESGSGKQALAEHLHEVRAGSGPFVRIVCGHLGDGENRFQLTAGSTIFLKHVHLLPEAGQEGMLLALERVNGDGPQLVSSAADVLEQLVARGGFLPELFYRLSAYRLCIPPLRERAADISELFRLMLGRMQAQVDTNAPAPPASVLDALAEYPWPGNVRELQNIVRSYLIDPDPANLVAEMARRHGALQAVIRDDEKQLALKDQVRRASRRLESEIILRTLERHRWNRRRTAENLQISYRSLLYKMKNCNIRTERPSAAEWIR